MRIALVDDASAMRAIFTHLAERLGHAIVAEFGDLEAALAGLAAADPDLIVLDGRLPGDALAAIPQLRAASPRAQVAVVAALDERSLVRAAREAGAVGAILRPFAASRLAADLAAFAAPRT
jgi:DNA-binding NarL/FixJ family response regulator